MCRGRPTEVAGGLGDSWGLDGRPWDGRAGAQRAGTAHGWAWDAGMETHFGELGPAQAVVSPILVVLWGAGPRVEGTNYQAQQLLELSAVR